MTELTVHLHHAPNLRLKFGGSPVPAHTVGWIDVEWDGRRDTEVSFFVPREHRTRYQRAVEAFNAVLADESIKEDVPAPEAESDFEIVSADRPD